MTFAKELLAHLDPMPLMVNIITRAVKLVFPVEALAQLKSLVSSVRALRAGTGSGSSDLMDNLSSFLVRLLDNSKLQNVLMKYCKQLAEEVMQRSGAGNSVKVVRRAAIDLKDRCGVAEVEGRNPGVVCFTSSLFCFT